MPLLVIFAYYSAFIEHNDLAVMATLYADSASPALDIPSEAHLARTARYSHFGALDR